MAIIDLENPLLEIVPGRNLATLKAIITNISQIHLQTNKFKEAVIMTYDKTNQGRYSSVMCVCGDSMSSYGVTAVISASP